MKEWICSALMISGATFMLLAAVGLVRLPDVLTRMHASTKASALGAGCPLLAMAIYFDNLEISARCFATILFYCITAPVAAHAIARAAIISGTELWEGTVMNELEGVYDLSTGEDASPAAPQPAIGAE
ncbi:MAG: monovalent cation/H(+) antiporter subunit G [Armatimonadota bacterium]